MTSPAQRQDLIDELKTDALEILGDQMHHKFDAICDDIDASTNAELVDQRVLIGTHGSLSNK